MRGRWTRARAGVSRSALVPRSDVGGGRWICVLAVSRPAVASSVRVERRDLADVDEAACPHPSDAQEPRAWWRHRYRSRRPGVQRMGRRISRRDEPTAAGMPSIEERGRRVRVDPGAVAARDAPIVARMLDAILQHVDQGVARLGRRAQVARVIAVSDDPAAAPGDPVEAARHAHAEALHGSTESDLVPGLDQKVDVIGLDRKVDDADAQTLARCAQRLAHGGIHAKAAKVATAAQHADRDVDREPRRESGPPGVPYLGAFSLRLAPGTTAGPTPCTGQAELELTCTPPARTGGARTGRDSHAAISDRPGLACADPALHNSMRRSSLDSADILVRRGRASTGSGPHSIRRTSRPPPSRAQPGRGPGSIRRTSLRRPGLPPRGAERPQQWSGRARFGGHPGIHRSGVSSLLAGAEARRKCQECPCAECQRCPWARVSAMSVLAHRRLVGPPSPRQRGGRPRPFSTRAASRAAGLPR
jgi:hypothetical protein